MPEVDARELELLPSFDRDLEGLASRAALANIRERRERIQQRHDLADARRYLQRHDGYAPGDGGAVSGPGGPGPDSAPDRNLEFRQIGLPDLNLRPRSAEERNEERDLLAATPLVPFAPVKGVLGREQYAYFTLKVPTACTIELSITATEGDPDLFVSTINPTPSRTAHMWTSAEAGDDILTISSHHPSFRPGDFHVAVYAGQGSAEYELLAKTRVEPHFTVGRDGEIERTDRGGQLLRQRIAAAERAAAQLESLLGGALMRTVLFSPHAISPRRHTTLPHTHVPSPPVGSRQHRRASAIEADVARAREMRAALRARAKSPSSSSPGRAGSSPERRVAQPHALRLAKVRHAYEKARETAVSAVEAHVASYDGSKALLAHFKRDALHAAVEGTGGAASPRFEEALAAMRVGASQRARQFVRSWRKAEAEAEATRLGAAEPAAIAARKRNVVADPAIGRGGPGRSSAAGRGAPPGAHNVVRRRSTYTFDQNMLMQLGERANKPPQPPA